MSENQTYDFGLAKKAAIEAADVACDTLRHYFKKVKHVTAKTGAGLVSEADKESERKIREVLEKHFSSVSILGEEEGRSNKGTSDALWLIDPLDGTHNYVCGFPIFCVSIGLQINGESVLGLVDAPALGQRFFAMKGQGATLNGEPMRVSSAGSLSEIIVGTGFSYQRGDAVKRQLRIFEKLLNKSLGVRRPGAAAYDMALVAAGVFGAFWEMGLSPWDTGAGTCLIREAGGTVTDWDGNPYKCERPDVVAGSPALHADVLREILTTP
jgi:myo-inositol-1(or 4)-monophosphatase